jgi:hypothetical protein
MTNFGILMEIKGIEDPFAWSRDVVQKCQTLKLDLSADWSEHNGGLYYSPSREISTTSEHALIKATKVDNLDVFKNAFGEYADYIMNFIDNMNSVFNFGDDWGMYIPEVKYLSPEPLVNYHNLSLSQFPNVHFVGDALSARGITVSGAHGIYCSEYILRESKMR